MWVGSWHELFNLMLNTLNLQASVLQKPLTVLQSLEETFSSAQCRTRKWDCCRCKDCRLCLTYLTLAVFYAPDLFPLSWTWIQTLSQWGRNVFHQRSDPVLIYIFFLSWTSGVWYGLGSKKKFSVHEPLFLSCLRTGIMGLLTYFFVVLVFIFPVGQANFSPVSG